MNEEWHRLDSGLLVPAGHSSSRTDASSETYLKMKERAIALEKQYEDAGVKIPAGSGIDVVVQNAKRLSDSWFLDGGKSAGVEALLNSAHLVRVAEAALTLRGHPEERSYLKRLASGTLNLLERDRTEAKDILWELELLGRLRSRGIAATLREPPDIVATYAGSTLGIACKKLYSEKNLEKVLSSGVAQIESAYEFGVVAINLDDLLPPNKILVQEDYESLGRWINQFNLDFLARHERHFRKYLSNARLLSALISTGLLSDVRSSDVRLNNARQSTLWTIPGLPSDKQAVFDAFRKSITD